MHIRFFSAYEPGWSFYRDLLPFLASRGARVDLVVSRSEYRAGRGSLDDAMSHPLIKVCRLPTWRGIVRNRFQKYGIMLVYMLTAAFKSLFLMPKSDLNFFLTAPPFFYVWGYVLKVLGGQRYCCLVMDVYPDVAVEVGTLERKGLPTRFLTLLSRFALRRADLVIVIGRCMREFLESEGVPPEHIFLITNWTDEQGIAPVPRDSNPLRRELGLETDFVVLYSGNIGASHYFDDILKVARRLNGVQDLRFVIIGGGRRLNEVEAAKEHYGLENIMLLPFQPAEKLSQSLSLGDVHFICLRDGFSGLAVPSKAYGALAVGRPIIYQGEGRGEIARMIHEERIGTVVPLGDPSALEKSILDYYHDPVRVAEEGDRSRHLAETRYSRASSLEKYRILL
jgi:glycosyltransferase involved in cell wall biosynthesis